MPLSMTDDQEETKAYTSPRIARLKKAVQNARPGICPERALIWTEYHKKSGNKRKSPHIQMAEALRDVLRKKTISIYPDELIVGNFSSKRVGGALFPELHGVPVMMDIFKFSKRETNPLEISRQEIFSLLKTVPFWLFRFLAFKAYRSPIKKAQLIVSQLTGFFYIINESAGISHIAPDYEKLIAIGTDGFVGEATKLQREVNEDSEAWCFYEAVKIICEALAGFGERYAALAEQMMVAEQDPVRKKELGRIAQVCKNVPRKGATSFHSAIQSIFFAQIAINMESLDNSVCPGRMDQYLYPFYLADIENEKITHNDARTLLSAFSIKMSEIVPVFSDFITNIHGGMFNGQVVTVGGVDKYGRDATNALSCLFLEVMDELRMRQPNYHARIHAESPQGYIDTINLILSKGGGSPALYNDDIIIETMNQHGYSLEDARGYTAVGCVEPVSQGKSFSSTDAALLNVPIILEMALNEGRRFGFRFRAGEKTQPISEMESMNDVKAAFSAQLRYQLKKLISDLKAIEIANKKYHPTPLTSMLLQGCLESGLCSTAGGALYNFSGIQCVAPADTGDALYAIEKAVFIEKRISLEELVNLLKRDIDDPKRYDYLKGLHKFGNDIAAVDNWTVYVADEFIRILSEFQKNTRGGRYVAGLYSVTAHDYFGKITGALPHGRRRGESFASGISPVNGMDKNGPTALINSINRFDFTKVANGINFNMQFDHHTLRGQTGKKALKNIIKTYFRKGGMQVQVNVFDPDILIKARDKPELFPNLLVRVSGYSAYFNDLRPSMKDEIIERNCVAFGGRVK